MMIVPLYSSNCNHNREHLKNLLTSDNPKTVEEAKTIINNCKICRHYFGWDIDSLITKSAEIKNHQEVK